MIKRITTCDKCKKEAEGEGGDFYTILDRRYPNQDFIPAIPASKKYQFCSTECLIDFVSDSLAPLYKK